MTKRKVSATSLVNVRNARLPLDKDGDRWTQEDEDHLLECYLVRDLRYQSGRDCFLMEIGRSWDAVYTHLWKIVTSYREAKAYKPVKRTDRTGTPFTARDIYLIKKATAPKARRNLAHLPSHLANVLGRSEEEVKTWLQTHGRRLLLQRETGI